MVVCKGALEGIIVGQRMRALVNIVSCGLIIANFVVCSSSSLEKSAPLSMTSTWLYLASFICGLALGMTLDEARVILHGVFSMALIAVLVFSSVLVLPALLNNYPFLDIVLLFAFQQSLVRFIFICTLGCVGVFFATLLRLFFGRL